jgi:hypothetical protein
MDREIESFVGLRIDEGVSNEERYQFSVSNDDGGYGRTDTELDRARVG